MNITKITPIMGLSLFAASTTLAAERPNIIYVFPDQYRNSSFGFWQQEPFASAIGHRITDPVLTPNLDRFAREAVVLTDAVATCPVSSPHRGMLLTGMYPERSGVVLNCMSERPESSLREDAECLSDVLAANGYDCAYIGKLHVDFPTRNNPQRLGTYVSDTTPEWDAYTPPARRHNFNYWYSYGTYDVHKRPHYWDTAGARHEVEQWSVQHEIGKAIDYIDNKKQERNAQKPFLMMLSLNPPHSPYESIEDCDVEGYELYKDKSDAELLTIPNADLSLKKAASARYYFANVSGVDREFGRLMETLDKAGLSENTIVVFASDHGETMCSHSIVDPKNSIYRESLNIPFLVRYPRQLKPRVDSILIGAPDIMPTLLGLAGLQTTIPTAVEGRDLSAALRGKHSAERPQAALYLRNLNGRRDAEGMVRGFFGEARGVKTNNATMEISINRDGSLKRILLFDDRRDPYQQRNLDPKTNAELFDTMCRHLAVLLCEANDVWYRERILSQYIHYKQR